MIIVRVTPAGREKVERALGPLLSRIAAIVTDLEPDELQALGKFVADVTRSLAEEVGSTATPSARRVTSPRVTRRTVTEPEKRETRCTDGY